MGDGILSSRGRPEHSDRTRPRCPHSAMGHRYRGGPWGFMRGGVDRPGDRLARHPAAPSSTSESAHHPPAHQEAPPLPYKNPVIATDFPDPDVVWTGAEYVAAATGTSTQHIQFATSRN